MKGTVVIGIGNILLKDDGVGVHIIKELQKGGLPSDIELVDGGTSTLNILGCFADYSKVIVIDSLKGGLEPGTIYRMVPDDIKSYAKGNMSLHDVQILDVVKMANMLGNYPEVVIFGIEPAEISYDLEMSPAIRRKIPELIGHVKKELGI